MKAVSCFAGGMPLWFGLAIVWGIRFCLYGSDSMFWLEGGNRQANDVFSVTMLMFEATTFFMLSLITRVRKTEPRLSWMGVLSVFLGLGVVGVLPSLIPVQLTFVSALGGGLCGVGFAILVLSWYRVCVHLDEDALPSLLSIAIMGGSAIMTILAVCPYPVALGCALVAVLISGWQLRHAEISYIQSDDFAYRRGVVKSSFRGVLPVLFSLLVMILLYIGISQLLYLGDRSFSWYNVYLGIVETISSCGVYFAVRSGRLNKFFVEISSALVVLSTLLAVGLLATGVVILSATIATFASHAMRMLAAISFCLYIKQNKASTFLVFGLVEGIMKLPTILGVLIALPLFQGGDKLLTTVVLAGVCLYAVAIALFAILNLSRKDASDAERRIRQLSAQQNLDYASFNKELSERTCDRIARRFRLSQRESEVLACLVQKETLSEISGNLFLSPNTVKTHTRSIYIKMDIHSKGDLLTIFGTTRQEVILEMQGDVAWETSL